MMPIPSHPHPRMPNDKSFRWRWLFPYGYCLAMIAAAAVGFWAVGNKASDFIFMCGAVVFGFILGANVVWSGNYKAQRS